MRRINNNIRNNATLLNTWNFLFFILIFNFYYFLCSRIIFLLQILVFKLLILQLVSHLSKLAYDQGKRSRHAYDISTLFNNIYIIYYDYLTGAHY